MSAAYRKSPGRRQGGVELATGLDRLLYPSCASAPTSDPAPAPADVEGGACGGRARRRAGAVVARRGRAARATSRGRGLAHRARGRDAVCGDDRHESLDTVGARALEPGQTTVG